MCDLPEVFESNAETVLSQIDPDENLSSGRRSSIGLASLKAKRDKLFSSLRTDEMSKLLRRQSFQTLLSPGKTLSRSTSVRNYEKPTSASSAKSTPSKTPVKSKREDNKENKRSVNTPAKTPAKTPTKTPSKLSKSTPNAKAKVPASAPIEDSEAISPLKRKRSTTSISFKKPKVINDVIKALASPSTIRRRSKRRIFGVPLETVMQNQEKKFPTLRIPVFVHKAIEYIYEIGLKEKGIFRISANAAQLAKYQQLIDEGHSYNFKEDSSCDCHFVACLLKSYFRQLPDCLFTQEKFSAFLSCLDESGPNLPKLKEHIDSLPQINRDLASALFKLLTDIAKNVEHNCMGTDNLASMNAPNILNSKTFELEAMMKANQVVKVIIENYSYFFVELEKTEDLAFDLNSSVCYTEDYDDLSEMSNFDHLEDDLEVVDFESKFEYDLSELSNFLDDA